MNQILTPSNIIVILSGPLTALVSVYLSTKVSNYKETKRTLDALILTTRHNRELCQSYLANNEERIQTISHGFELSAYNLVMQNGTALKLDMKTRDNLRNLYTRFRSLDSLSEPGIRNSDPEGTYTAIEEAKDKADELESDTVDFVKKYGYTSFPKYLIKSPYHKVRITYKTAQFKLRNRNSDSSLDITPEFK